MIARLAAGDDSFGSSTVAVLSLLYIGPTLQQLAKTVAFQESIHFVLIPSCVLEYILFLWLNVTFDTQFCLTFV